MGASGFSTGVLSNPQHGGVLEATNTTDVQLHKTSKMCSLFWPWLGVAPPASADRKFIIHWRVFASGPTGALLRLFPGIPAGPNKHVHLLVWRPAGPGPVRGQFRDFGGTKKHLGSKILAPGGLRVVPRRAKWAQEIYVPVS